MYRIVSWAFALALWGIVIAGSAGYANVPAFAGVHEGMTVTEARTRLIRAGYRPVRLASRDCDERCRYYETVSCSADGYCMLAYLTPDRRRIVGMTTYSINETIVTGIEYRPDLGR